jgi:hypothetical protein
LSVSLDGTGCSVLSLQVDVTKGEAMISLIWHLPTDKKRVV